MQHFKARSTYLQNFRFLILLDVDIYFYTALREMGMYPFKSRSIYLPTYLILIVFMAWGNVGSSTTRNSTGSPMYLCTL